MWFSFITGLLPKNTQSEDLQIVKVPSYSIRAVLSNLYMVLAKTRLDHSEFLWRFIDYTKLSYRFKHTWRDYARKGISTIFDEIKPSIALFVPTYTPFTERKFVTLVNAIGNPAMERLYVYHEYKNLKKQINILFRNLKRRLPWRLFMVYFSFTDHLGHLYRGNLSKMRRIYALADRLAHSVKSFLPEDALFLIISDHGMRPAFKGSRYGVHSEYGFYSLNVPLRLKYPKIQDFPYILKRVLKG